MTLYFYVCTHPIHSRTYSSSFDDFFVTTIGDSAQTDTQFWGILLNWQFTPVGGCQQHIAPNDEVLWAFDAFNVGDFLKLDGPKTVRRNRPFKLTVTDGSTGALIAGADVDGHISDAKGVVTISYGSVGRKSVKATKDNAIRSNRLDIRVVP
jgi:hypothetical protein